MSTESGSNPPDGDDIDELLGEPTDPRDDQIAALQGDIEGLKNKHQEDKFLWFIAAMAIFDVAALLRADNWSGPLVVGIIELIALIVMADRCRVDVVAPLIDKLIGGLNTLGFKKKDE